MTNQSTPAAARDLTDQERETIRLYVEHDFKRVSEEQIVHDARAWKRAAYARLRDATLADEEVRAQLAVWHRKLSTVPGRPGTLQQRAEVRRKIVLEQQRPMADAYTPLTEEQIERLIDRELAA